MKKSDFDDVVTLLSNPDTTADGLVELSRRLDTVEQEFTKLDESNKNLRDTNSKLSLSIINKLPNVAQETHEETDDEAFDRLFTSKFKEVEHE